MTPFDPNQHIMVVRDKSTGRHVHVEWSTVIAQIAAAPSATAVDLSPLTARVAALECRPAPETVDISSLVSAVADASAQLATIAHRLAQLERKHETHEHNYNFSAEQVSTIVAAVADRTGRAA